MFATSAEADHCILDRNQLEYDRLRAQPRKWEARGYGIRQPSSVTTFRLRQPAAGSGTSRLNEHASADGTNDPPRCFKKRKRVPSIRTCLGLAALLAFAGLPATPVASSEVLVVPKLVASDGVASDNLGHVLARSGDVLVAGAPFANVSGEQLAGAAYIFVRDPVTGVWVEQKKLVSEGPVAFDNFGWSVAVDGDTIAVGVPDAEVDDTIAQGAVHVFDRDAGARTTGAR